MPDRLTRLDLLERFYDGAIPCAELAAALGRSAAAIQVRRGALCDRMARDAVAAVARRRRALSPAALDTDRDLGRLGKILARTRHRALAAS